MGPGGTYEEDNFFRRNIDEYPEFKKNADTGPVAGLQRRPSSQLSNARSVSSMIKPNAPFRCNFNYFVNNFSLYVEKNYIVIEKAFLYEIFSDWEQLR
jgi:hypothetical protein